MAMKLLKLYLTKKLIDSASFMASSLSNHVDNLTEGIKIKFKDCDCLFQYESVKENLIKYKCLPCNENYSNKLDEELKKEFKNTFKFSKHGINKSIFFFLFFFFFLLRKGVYPHEYIDDWEMFHETILPEKKRVL